MEFSKSNYTETVIEKVYHRFNTAQRECLKNPKYYDIHYDDLVGDIYDVHQIDPDTDAEEGGSPTGFTVSSYTVNKIIKYTETGNEVLGFPGNIMPEGYYYSPFTEVQLKEIDDSLQSMVVRRINFIPGEASAYTAPMSAYNPETGVEEVKNMQFIKIAAPVPQNIIAGQPFCIYDVLDDMTYRGHLESLKGREMTICLEDEISNDGLRGGQDTSGNKRSRYIISVMNENAPEAAEFIPTSQRLVWRQIRKPSELTNDSPLYNMPFTNGRCYIQQNVNFFLRRQDPTGEYHLFRTSNNENQLMRYQVEGYGKLDFDYIKYITDSMVNAC